MGEESDSYDGTRFDLTRNEPLLLDGGAESDRSNADAGLNVGGELGAVLGPPTPGAADCGREGGAGGAAGLAVLSEAV